MRWARPLDPPMSTVQEIQGKYWIPISQNSRVILLFPVAVDDSLEEEIDSLLEISQAVDVGVWSFVKTIPDLFTKRGLFYELVKRDYGLEDNNHIRLPHIPGKVC